MGGRHRRGRRRRDRLAFHNFRPFIGRLGGEERSAARTIIVIIVIIRVQSNRPRDRSPEISVPCSICRRKTLPEEDDDDCGGGGRALATPINHLNSGSPYPALPHAKLRVACSSWIISHRPNRRPKWRWAPSNRDIHPLHSNDHSRENGREGGARARMHGRTNGRTPKCMRGGVNFHFHSAVDRLAWRRRGIGQND